MENLFHILKLSLVTSIAFSGVGHVGANPNKKAQEKINQVMSEAMKGSDLPAVVAVGIDSKGNQFDFMHGGLSWGKEEKITGDSIFRIHSMTKMITSMAAMQLVEQGKLKLHEDLSDLMPQMTSIPIMKADGGLVEPKNVITLHHLLTHTAGFGYPDITYKQNPRFNKDSWNYEDFPRQFESGTRFLYGTNTDWVGKIVEKVSGMSLEAYFRKYIFAPLGINSTYFNVPERDKKRITSLGNRGPDGKGKLREIDGDEYSPNRYPLKDVIDYSGGGGLFSTPNDFTKILKCMLNYGANKGRRVLKKATVKEMIKNQIGEISLDPTGWYFDPVRCCNFEGLMDGNSKWGLAFMIDNTPKSYGRKAGTVLWGGYRNTYFYLDYKSGIAASIYSQHLPFNHEATITLFDKFSEVFYRVKK
jgi:CubicO group peptidase (beta-lactamase class C family)